MISEFFHNYLLMIPAISWFVAQIIKVIIELVLHKNLSVERMFGAGGMPSSHSALVTSMFVAAAKKYGVASPYFAISLLFAFIVMYDAMGVRHETGKQAKILNLLLEDLKRFGESGYELKLKEMVGHTPLQVLSGAVLGAAIALTVPMF